MTRRAIYNHLRQHGPTARPVLRAMFGPAVMLVRYRDHGMRVSSWRDGQPVWAIGTEPDAVRVLPQEVYA